MIGEIKNIGKYKYENVNELNDLCESLHEVLLEVFGNVIYDFSFRGVSSGDTFEVSFDLGQIDTTDTIFRGFWMIMRILNPDEKDKNALHRKYLQSCSNGIDGLSLCVASERLEDDWNDSLLNSPCRILREGNILLKPKYHTQSLSHHVSDNVVY